MKKTVMKVTIYCVKCRTKIFKAVAKLTGINQISMDTEKGTLTVVGDADPMLIVCQVRKTGKFQEIVSVGPDKPEEKKPEKKPESKKPDLPQCCKHCQPVSVIYISDEIRPCTIL